MSQEGLINGLISEDDIIRTGWLTKSPPQKKIKNATSWTNRYFRLLYLKKEAYDEFKKLCTKVDREEERAEELEAEKQDVNPNRLCLAFWKNESHHEKPFRAICLRGSSVSPLDSHPYWGNRFPNLILLMTVTRRYFFSDRDNSSGKKWVEVLDEAIKLNNVGELTVTTS